MPAIRTARFHGPIRPVSPAPRRALLDHPVTLAAIAVVAAVVLKFLGSRLASHAAAFLA
jgi:hypothetical protein